MPPDAALSAAASPAVDSYQSHSPRRTPGLSRRHRRIGGEILRILLGSSIALAISIPTRVWKASTEQEEMKRDLREIKATYVPEEVHKVRWENALQQNQQVQKQMDDVARRIDTVRTEQQQGFRDLSRQIFDLANGKAPQQARSTKP